MNVFEIPIPNEKLRTAQIISIALPLGALSFLGITLFNTSFPAGLNSKIDIMEFVLLGQVFITVPLAFFLPAIIFANNSKKSFGNIDLESEVQKESLVEDDSKHYINLFFGHYQTSMIIGSALLEGTALFAIIVYQVNQSVCSLVVAGVLILLQLTKIPTESRVQNSLAGLMNQFQTKRTL